MERQTPANDDAIRLAVLISGSGTSLQNLIDQIACGALNARIMLVVGSRAGLAGLDRARNAQLKTTFIDPREFSGTRTFSKAVFEAIDAAGVELVCLAGWLSLLEIPEHWHRRVINIHPSLLPEFGGKGMYGRRVHQAVLDAGRDVSGCTVHYVDDTFDTGEVILQRRCPVLADDTAATLAERVFEQEKIAYPEAIRLYAASRRRDGAS